MILGRRKKSPADEPDLDSIEEQAEDTAADDEPEDQADDAEFAESAVPGITDEWSELDASSDWREDGPFDASEVDLDADEVDRLDFGALIVTPSPEVGIQLRVDEDQTIVIAILATHEESGLEITLFAAPARTSMLPEVRKGISEGVAQAGGSVEVAEGPFGAELRQLLPVTGPEGESLLSPGRIWLVEGPGWLLRGTLMGRAALEQDLSGSAGVLLEFFRNLVVTRDERPRVPGDLIRLTMPEGLVPTPPPQQD